MSLDSVETCFHPTFLQPPTISLLFEKTFYLPHYQIPAALASLFKAVEEICSFSLFQRHVHSTNTVRATSAAYTLQFSL